MMKTFLLLVIIALSLSASGQTTPAWVKVATESNTLTVSTPITVRYGASSGITTAGVDCSRANCWVVVLLTSATNLSLNDASCCVFGMPDPAPGVVKELDVQQGTAAITVMVSGKAVIVPALPPPPPPPPTTTTYAITCTATATLTNGAPMPATLPLTDQSCRAVKQ